MGKSRDGKQAEQRTLPTHGASRLPSVEVESYNLEIEDEDGFVGDKASKGAFREILDRLRNELRKSDEDPLGDKASEELSKKKLDSLLTKGSPESAAVVQSALEDFAQQLASVIKRFLRLKAWRDTECIVVGGGFRASRVGELAIARAGLLIKGDEKDVDLQLIHNDPDEAGLLGSAHLLPAWMLDGHDAILAADVGGTNIRAGLVELNLGKAKDLSKARVVEMKLWRHADESIKRDEAVQRFTGMLRGLIKTGLKDNLRLAPVIGIGCPGMIEEDGSISSGAQNLPGDWESSTFNLPEAVRDDVPTIGDHETMVVMHNDAVVQGLSELPYLRDRQRWAALTIGTGLGNASFSMRGERKRRR